MKISYTSSRRVLLFGICFVLFAHTMSGQARASNVNQSAEVGALHAVIIPNKHDATEDYPTSNAYKLSALLEFEQNGSAVVYAGLIDQRSGHNFLISSGKKRNGLELISVNLDRQEVLLRQEDDVFLVAMDAGTHASNHHAFQPSHLRQAILGDRNSRASAAAERRRIHYAHPPFSTHSTHRLVSEETK